ncbi:BspA family leucine-rich repeat surface protein, partial [Salmonella sp. gx-f5]|uniref:BspA family leucine-rich repeat surface protein n=1 Tax=Salmonella sp. gx-f5 TaxID=2582605 RepID=UPI0034D43F2C
MVFNASFANARPTSCNEWFFSCSNLTTIEGIEYLNTAKVTNMNKMFDNCESLKSLDLTKFNTE